MENEEEDDVDENTPEGEGGTTPRRLTVSVAVEY